MKLSSEERLLISCAPSGGRENVAKATDIIGSNSISWDRVMQLAHWHRVTGMLFLFLRDSGSSEALRESDMDDLREHYRHTSVRSLYIRSEFARVTKALQAENIEVMALKGIALIGTVYPDAGVREMTDIDLLIRPEQAEHAQEIATGLGYEAVGTEAAQERTREVHRHLPKLHNHDRELSIEIHTHFVSNDSPLHFDIDTVWQHASKTTLHGVDVLVPSPEHMVIHLCLHFFLDRRFTSGSSLKQLNDLASYLKVESEKIDWDFFIDEVQKNRLEGPVFSILSTAITLLSTDVPAHVLESLRPTGYSEKMHELFVRQRVLQMHKLTATELVPHEDVYTVGAMFKGVLRRMAPSRLYMETHYGSEAVDDPNNTRMKRIGEMFKRGFNYTRNPLRLWQEVRVDRWLHSLSNSEAATRDEKRRSS